MFLAWYIRTLARAVIRFMEVNQSFAHQLHSLELSYYNIQLPMLCEICRMDKFHKNSFNSGFNQFTWFGPTDVRFLQTWKRFVSFYLYFFVSNDDLITCGGWFGQARKANWNKIPPAFLAEVCQDGQRLCCKITFVYAWLRIDQSPLVYTCQFKTMHFIEAAAELSSIMQWANKILFVDFKVRSFYS